MMQLCTPDISASDAVCVFCTRETAVHISVLDTLGAFCSWSVTTRRRLWGSQISVLDDDEQIFKKIHIFSIIFLDDFCATILFQNNGFTVCFVDSSATPRCQSWTRINRFANKNHHFVTTWNVKYGKEVAYRPPESKPLRSESAKPAAYPLDAGSR